MEPTQLALFAAQAIVQAMATDMWGTVRDRVARLLGGDDPDRARRTAQALDRTRDDLDANPAAADTAVGHWHGRLELLAEESPRAAALLADLVKELEESGRGGTRVTHVTQHARGRQALNAGGNITNAGRDVNPGRRRRG